MESVPLYHSSEPTDQPRAPIRPAYKPKGKGRMKNVFMDDRGFPDPSDDFDHFLHNMDECTLVRKRKHPPRPIDGIDPAFDVQYDEAIHGEKFDKDFKPSPLLTDEQNKQLADLIKEFWCVFDDKGLFVPIKDYEVEVNTGTAAPIAIKKIQYGPRETPIMRKAITKLAELKQISQIQDGQWLFKALLAPKPHQEHVCDIKDFVWRFCVNYIRLNSVTKQIIYPIPRCDAAVSISFGKAKFWWLMDAPMGYHQMKVAENSSEKMAFQGTDAIKWTYNVMPFGPVNCPATFIMFIHDMDANWKDLAKSKGIEIGDDTNTRIIVDNIFSFAITFLVALQYLRCQLMVCPAQNLSLKLGKCHFFPVRVEYVGIDVTREGNRPAQSKFDLLKTWPKPTIIRDIASFVGFAVFYAAFIPLFETRVQTLRSIMKFEYNDPVGDKWTDKAQDEWNDISKALLDDPVLKRFDPNLRLYLLTDFCKDGFGYCACQPGDDTPSIDAMRREMKGGDCKFLVPGTDLSLHPVAFGSRKTRGNEVILHSHLGEGFAGDWAINKCRHMAFGMQFTWLTDCYALRFILSYDGNKNPAVLRLQMRLMCWNMTIVHRPGTMMVHPDYLSRLGADLCFDPMLRDYLDKIHALKQANPPVKELPIKRCNMPGYRKKRKVSLDEDEDTVSVTLSTVIHSQSSNGHENHLSNVPICFGCFEAGIDLTQVYKATPLNNSELVLAARHIFHFQWAVYSFNSGHFVVSIQQHSLPFRVVLGAGAFAEGRTLFKEFTDCTMILPGARELYDHVRNSGDTSKIDGYLLHSHRFPNSGATRAFWQLQASIIEEFRNIRQLSLFVALVHPDHDCRSISHFTQTLTKKGWILSDSSLYFPHYGDSVASNSRVIIGVHSNTEEKVEPVHLPAPPQIQPSPIASFVWQPFNDVTYAISYSRSNPKFSIDNSANPMPSLKASDPVISPSSNQDKLSSKILYCLHHKEADPSIQCGSNVVCSSHLSPPFSSVTTDNLFGHWYGIEFYKDGGQYVRPISNFEAVRCHSLPDVLTYRLSHKDFQYNLDAAIPALTSSYLFRAIDIRMQRIRDSNIQIFEPRHIHAPAALSNVFVNGATGTKLPNQEAWIAAYDNDPETKLIRDCIKNPSLVMKENLKKVHHTYRMPLRQSLFIIEDDMLVYREPLGQGSDSYVKLRLVPSSLRNLLFIAYHANPIGGHFHYERTYRNLRLRYMWPEMFKYCKEMCAKCPACALANRSKRVSSELVYGFPVTAPMMVLHLDAFSAGKHLSFDGDAT